MLWARRSIRPHRRKVDGSEGAKSTARKRVRIARPKGWRGHRKAGVQDAPRATARTYRLKTAEELE